MNRRYFAAAGVAAVAGLAGWGAARWSGAGRSGSSGLSPETVAVWAKIFRPTLAGEFLGDLVPALCRGTPAFKSLLP